MEHRLVGWQSAPSSGSVTPSTDSYLYDGEGRRVEQDAVAQLTCPPEAPSQGSCGSVTTDTVYLSGDAEEIASNGSIVTSTTKTYSAGGLLLGTLIASGGTESLHVLASDGLGSVSVALDSSGNVTAQQLYGPYGGVRYTWGSMPTAKGYTGQQGDALTGLDYYGARYYDPLVGQFLTPDSNDKGGMNRYAYVGGNPETRTDPTGHLFTCQNGCGNGSPHDGTKAGACGGYDHCVILITGVHVGLGNAVSRTRKGFGADEEFWAVWMDEIQAQYSGDVGFILAPDAQTATGGADTLHSIMGGLGTVGYSGTISVVGESNGAAALFTYMARSALGGYGGDPRINKFVAIDAPTASYPIGEIEKQLTKTVWAQWDPTTADVLSALYVRQHGTQGLYAWNIYDSLSGPMVGPWGLAPRAIIPDGEHVWNIGDVHNALIFDPDAQLIDAALA